MANQFDNLLNASLAASQLRQGYNQLAVQDKQATGSLLQRRAEQEQQGQQFVMSLNQQKSEQASRADQFNRSLNFNYSQLRQQDKWANIEDQYKNKALDESTRQFGMTFEEGKRQFGLSHTLAANQASHYGKSVDLLELQWKAKERQREIELETAELDLAERKGDSTPWPSVEPFTNPPKGLLEGTGWFGSNFSFKNQRTKAGQLGVEGNFFDKATTSKGVVDLFLKAQEDYKTHPSKAYLDDRLKVLDSIYSMMAKRSTTPGAVQIDSKTYASARIEYNKAVNVFERDKNLMSKNEREVYLNRLQLLQSAFDPEPPPEK
jgi:hypothetical protein